MIYLRLIITYGPSYNGTFISHTLNNFEVSGINVPDIVSPIFKLSNDIE